MSLHPSVAKALLASAEEAASRSFVPYSGKRHGCALLLSDGSTIPGTRVESASFSLVIPAFVNAFSTAAALGRLDVVAVAGSQVFLHEDVAFLNASPAGTFELEGDRIALRPGASAPTEALGPLSPFLLLDGNSAGPTFEAARSLADRAVVPESDFPVACLLQLDDGRAIPGVNVEHSDWSRIICAERNALGTMVSYGLRGPAKLFLTCPRDKGCSPCGACRQLLAELAPEAPICLDRGEDPPDCTTPRELLPGFFSGNAIPGRR